jgi:hypothetical protein
VWGPSKASRYEYQIRVKLITHLRTLGHHAEMSEDLCSTPGALANPIHDERLQALDSNLVIVLYGSRGTQTEVDTILDDPTLARKAIIFIDARIRKAVGTSAAGKNWEALARCAQIVEYNPRHYPKCLLQIVEDKTHALRQAAFIQDLRLRPLHGE